MKTQAPSSKRVAGGISALDVARHIRTPEQIQLGAEIAAIAAGRAAFWAEMRAMIRLADTASDIIHIDREERASLARSLTLRRLNHHRARLGEGAERRRHYAVRKFNA